MRSNLAILIPAAGRARRFGKPKQLLPWMKSTLLETCIDKAKSLQPEHCVVLTGAYHKLIKEVCVKMHVDTCYVEDWDKGLGRTLARGVDYILQADLPIERILVILPDQPLVNITHLERLLIASENHSIAATKYPKGHYGVPAVMSSSFFDHLLALSGDSGARIFLKENQSEIKGVEPDFELRDIDTPEDYLKMLEG